MAAGKVRPHRKSGPSGPSKPHSEREGVRVDLYLPNDLAKRVDGARGPVPRAVWIRQAIEMALQAN